MFTNNLFIKFVTFINVFFMADVYLLTGGNLGDRIKNLHKAIELISKGAGKITDRSSIYETEPWGFNHELNFLNQVLKIDSLLDPLELLKEIFNIETILGREKRSSTYSARIIDIDILFYGNKIIKSDKLVIPHPKIHERMFTLTPMAELNPDFIHPELKKTIIQLKNECKDTKRVKKI